MITPAFELTQNEKFLIANIQVPFAKVSDVEIEFDDYDFMFYSKPYFLRLNLPGKVIYEEDPSVKYDFDKKIFVIQMPKAQEGEIFQNLDLLTKLLEPKKGKVKTAPLIEVIEGAADEDSDEELNWNIEQTPSSEEFGKLNICGEQCGFGNKYSFTVFNLQEETEEIFDIKNPQNKTHSTRKDERMIKESEDFDEDHYIADLYEDDAIQQILNYQPEWEKMYEEQTDSFCVDEKIFFTSEEKDRLLKLPNKEYILDKAERVRTFYSLIDILFAYAYNKRTTEGENTVESAWTINKLSATLSWLDNFNSITEVAQTCIRRSLSYPLFRHFELSVTALEDVRKILLLGRKYTLKCLLEIHELFNSSDPRYLLNDLFITDYCVWMQTKKCSSQKLKPLAEELGKILLTKGDIGLNLVDIESFAAVAWLSQASPKCLSVTSSQASKTTLKEITTNLDKLSINISSKRHTASSSSSSSSSSSESSQSDKSESYSSEFEICNPCSSESSDSSSSSFDSYESSDSDSD